MSKSKAVGKKTQKKNLFLKNINYNDLIGESCIIVSNKNKYPCKSVEEFFDVFEKNVDKSALIETNDKTYIWKENKKFVPKAALEGKSVMLFRNYTNKVKKHMYNVVSGLFKEEEGNDPRPTLLCIGSGQGGDMWKYNSFKKVMIVEPDEEHIEIMKERFKKQMDRDPKAITYDYKIVKDVGQNFEAIRDEAREFFESEDPDVVSFMLSLTFFNLEDKEQHENLIKLAKLGQVVMFLTADKKLVKNSVGYEPEIISYEIIEEPQKGVVLTPGVKPSDASELFKIDIPASIVKEQTEFLFDTDLFLKDLTKDGSKVVEEGFLDQEALLGPDEKWLSTHYRYAIVINKS